MPIIDGGVIVRLYPAVVPRHLNAAAGAHQYFCTEDRRKRGTNDEVIVSVDPTYVSMVSCGVELQEFKEQNPQLAFLRIEIRIKNNVEVSMAKSVDDFRPGAMHFYTNKFDIRRAGVGGQVSIGVEAFGYGVTCTPHRIACRYELRKISLWQDVSDHFTDRNAVFSDERKILSIPRVKPRQSSQEDEGSYRSLFRPIFKTENPREELSYSEATRETIQEEEEVVLQETVNQVDTDVMGTDVVYNTVDDRGERSTTTALPTPVDLIPECHQERLRHRVRFSDVDSICSIDKSSRPCDVGFERRQPIAGSLHGGLRSILKGMGKATIRLRRPNGVVMDDRTSTQPGIKAEPTEAVNFSDSNGELRSALTIDAVVDGLQTPSQDEHILDYVGSPSSRVDALPVQAYALSARPELLSELRDAHMHDTATTEDYTQQPVEQVYDIVQAQNHSTLKVKTEIDYPPATCFDGISAHEPLSKTRTRYDHPHFDTPVRRQEEISKVKRELAEVELEVVEVKKESIEQLL